MDRAFTFADPRIIELLRTRFVCVAQDSDYTERRRGQDALTRFFDPLVAQRPMERFDKGVPDAAQGYYAFDHNGRLYDAMSFIYVDKQLDRLLGMLQAAVARHAKDPPARATPDADRPATYPAVPDDVVVLRVWTRVRPLPENVNDQNQRLARDFMWVRRDEVAGLARGEAPESFTRRLALGHLRDNVRGEPRTFEPDHLHQAELRATATPVDGQTHVALRGRFRIFSPPVGPETGRELPEMGLEVELEGLLILDGERVVEWQMYADCIAWGDYVNSPGTPEGRYPLKIAFTLAAEDDPLARVIPPLGASGDPKVYLEEGVATRNWGEED